MLFPQAKVTAPSKGHRIYVGSKKKMRWDLTKTHWSAARGLQNVTELRLFQAGFIGIVMKSQYLTNIDTEDHGLAGGGLT